MGTERTWPGYGILSFEFLNFAFDGLLAEQLSGRTSIRLSTTSMEDH